MKYDRIGKDAGNDAKSHQLDQYQEWWRERKETQRIKWKQPNVELQLRDDNEK